MANLQNLPSIAACNIMSLLPWKEKLWMADHVCGWQAHLCTFQAWPSLEYEDSAHSWRGRQQKKQILTCLSIYGRYITDITFYFKKDSEMHVERVLQTVGKSCANLKVVRIHNLHFCMDTLADMFVQMLVKCTKLKDVRLYFPETYLCSRGNIVNTVALEGQSKKITELLLMNDSFDSHDGELDILEHFTSLRRLRIRRRELSTQVLLALVNNKLKTLSIFKDEECLLGEPLVYTPELWQHVLSFKPDFKTNLVLSNIVVVKTMFPAYAPLQAVIFVDLSSTLTKGKIDLISEYYSKTLEIFVYTQTNTYQSAEMADKRLPKSLPNLVNCCKKLRSLVYGYEISSTTLLLIANVRGLKHLVITEEELSYEMDWDSEEEWTEAFVSWLQQSGTDALALEAEISCMFGYNWRLATADNNDMREAVEYYSNL